MTRAESLRGTIETSAVRLRFCHMRARRPPYHAAGRPSQFNALPLGGRYAYSTFGRPESLEDSLQSRHSGNRQTASPSASLRSGRSRESPWTRNVLRHRNTRRTGSRSIGRRTLYVACVPNCLAARRNRVTRAVMLLPELEVTRMTTRYELVEWENLGYNLPQSLPYLRTKTIAEAAANIRSARTFAVAVENGVRRPLTETEELEFQSAYSMRYTCDISFFHRGS